MYIIVESIYTHTHIYIYIYRWNLNPSSIFIDKKLLFELMGNPKKKKKKIDLTILMCKTIVVYKNFVRLEVRIMFSSTYFLKSLITCFVYVNGGFRKFFRKFFRMVIKKFKLYKILLKKKNFIYWQKKKKIIIKHTNI